jgi:HAD superfamily hydrolase (TIGR01509 family)
MAQDASTLVNPPQDTLPTTGKSVADLKADIRDTRRRIDSTIAMTTRQIGTALSGGPTAVRARSTATRILGIGAIGLRLVGTVRHRMSGVALRRAAVGATVSAAVVGLILGTRAQRRSQARHRRSELARLTAVIFDIDGTLVDSNAAHAETWVEALREHGIPCDAAQVRPLIGMGGDKLLPRIANIEEDSAEGRAIAKRKKELFAERMPDLAPTPGARALIAHLRRLKKNVVIATSADDREMAALLEQSGVADLIPSRASKDDARQSKPNPDIVRAALERARVPSARALMIGDTPYDIEAAKRAGVQSIALRCGGHWSDKDLAGAVAVFDDPADLLSYWRR